MAAAHKLAFHLALCAIARVYLAHTKSSVVMIVKTVTQGHGSNPIPNPVMIDTNCRIRRPGYRRFVSMCHPKIKFAVCHFLHHRRRRAHELAVRTVTWEVSGLR